MRADIHHICNRSLRLLHRFVLKPLPKLVEQHDGDGFRILADTECACRGNGHEQVFVKDLTFHKRFGGFNEDVEPEHEVCENEAGDGDGLMFGEQVKEACARNGECCACDVRKKARAIFVAAGVVFGSFGWRCGDTDIGFEGVHDLLDNVGPICGGRVFELDRELLFEEGDPRISDPVESLKLMFDQRRTIWAAETSEVQDFVHGACP